MRAGETEPVQVFWQTERRRSRTYPAWGYQTSPVLKCARHRGVDYRRVTKGLLVFGFTDLVVLRGPAGYEHVPACLFAGGLQSKLPGRSRWAMPGSRQILSAFYR